jgi:hypothetical protein
MENTIIDTCECQLNASYQYWKERASKARESRKILRRTTKIIRANTFKPTASGDEILEKIQYLLEKGFGVDRSTTQVQIHKEFIESCLPKIYEATWATNSARILKQFNVKQLIQEVLVVMPRRRGKTYSTAMFAAAALLCIPGCSCIIFSTGERTAKMLMTVITDMIERSFANGAFKREDFQFETNNKETMVFFGPDGSKRSLMCLPGSVRVTCFFFFQTQRAQRVAFEKEGGRRRKEGNKQQQKKSSHNAREARVVGTEVLLFYIFPAKTAREARRLCGDSLS